jgi:nicotinamidase-related amidase
MSKRKTGKMAATNPAGNFLDKDNSLLMVIDVQQKLAPAISGVDAILNRLQALLQAAPMMSVPIVFTEHCPQKIGYTVDSLRELAADASYVEKTHFGAMREAGICAQLNAMGRRQIILAGTEAHVCVMQTALGLLESDYDVYLAIDATGSRERQDKEIAVQRLCQAGATLVTSEMVLFEWLEHADAGCFSEILGLVKAMGK